MIKFLQGSTVIKTVISGLTIQGPIAIVYMLVPKITKIGREYTEKLQ